MRITSFSTVSTLIVSVLVASCSSPKALKEDPREKATKELQLSEAMAEKLQTRLEIARDQKLESYMNRIALALIEGSKKPSDPKERDPKVLLFHSSKNTKWMNYGFLGNRFYLSLEILRTLEFENEFAAALGVALAQIGQKIQPNLTPEEGAKAERENELKAARQAVNILYAAGYDPRGVVSFYRKMGENPRSMTFSPSAANEITEEARREIALHSPLRNPIVKSSSFQEIHRRILRL